MGRFQVLLCCFVSVIAGFMISWFWRAPATATQTPKASLKVISDQVRKFHEDYERRTIPLAGGQSISDYWDVSALDQFPEAYQYAMSVYLQSVEQELVNFILTRDRYFHLDRSASSSLISIWPDDVNPVLDRKIIVPLIILPRPETVEEWCNSEAGRSAGWRSADDALSNRNPVYGRTLYFEPGDRSGEPAVFPPAPLGATIPQGINFLPVRSSTGTFYRYLEKVVAKSTYDGPYGPLSDETQRLRFGEADGATLLGELQTAPAHFENGRLWWVDSHAGSETRRFLAFALIDGNGGLRTKDLYQQTDPGLVSPYLRPLKCSHHQPRIKQHDLLLMPGPLVWPSTAVEYRKCGLEGLESYEMWCLDDWFPAQQDAVWVIRETAESQPLKEAFEPMPAREKSDNPIFLVAVFAETPPAQLLQELAALKGGSAKDVLDSPEKMKELESAYQAVRNAAPQGRNPKKRTF